MKNNNQKLALKPFSAENAPDNSHINVQLQKARAFLKVVFELTARLAEINIPGFQPVKAQRKDNLWEHTCFEIFLARHGMPDYREFNLSPSGDWNVYSFSGYRKGMKPDICFNTFPFGVTPLRDQGIKLEAAIDLKFIHDFSDIDVGLSAVLELNNGLKSYWALSHPGDAPDFHARDGWFKSF